MINLRLFKVLTTSQRGSSCSVPSASLIREYSPRVTGYHLQLLWPTINSPRYPQKPSKTECSPENQCRDAIFRPLAWNSIKSSTLVPSIVAISRKVGASGSALPFSQLWTSGTGTFRSLAKSTCVTPKMAHISRSRCIQNSNLQIIQNTTNAGCAPSRRAIRASWQLPKERYRPYVRRVRRRVY